MLTPSVNYSFLIDSFVRAKNEYKEYLASKEKLGSTDPKILQANEARLKGVTLEGASRTGKTWDFFIFLCQYLNKYEGKSITIARDTHTNLRDTTYQTMKKVWSLFDYDSNVFNKMATSFEYLGNQINFLGINDNIMKSHGHESDLLFINEVMGVPKDTVKQLEQRCTEFFVYDFNPSAIDHWVFDYENRPDVLNFKTTIFDNEYAPENSKNKILSYAHPETDDWDVVQSLGWTKEEWEKKKQKNLELKTADKTAWEVYGLGRRSVSEDVVFANWDLYTEEPKEYEWMLYGLDFGYKTDETAHVQVFKNGHDVYVKQLLYKTGYLNNQIASHIIEGGHNDSLVICDTAPAQNVDELRALNVNAVRYPNKKPGSKEWSIQQMQQVRLHIHVNSLDLQGELKKLRWAKLTNGEFKRNSLGQRVAVDKDDHAIQAALYAFTYYMSAYDKNE